MLGIAVQNPSKDDLNWNDDKIGVNREDFYAQVVIKHSVLKATWNNMKRNFVKVDHVIRASVHVLGQNEW